jgi:hypothetical protein
MKKLSHQTKSLRKKITVAHKPWNKLRLHINKKMIKMILFKKRNRRPLVIACLLKLKLVKITSESSIERSISTAYLNSSPNTLIWKSKLSLNFTIFSTHRSTLHSKEFLWSLEIKKSVYIMSFSLFSEIFIEKAFS